MVKVLPIGGTWSWRGDLEDHRNEWWHPQSPFMAYLYGEGFEHVCPDDPFVWTTHVGGALFWAKSHTDWMAGSAAFSYYCAAENNYGPTAGAYPLHVIAHSHAGQVCAYAAAFRGVRFESRITVASPVRKDMMAVYKAAQPNIRHWLHIASPGWSDRMQWLGEMFDGSVGIKRMQPFAHVNHMVPSIGHSSILRDPKRFGLWESHGWLDCLRGT